MVTHSIVGVEQISSPFLYPWPNWILSTLYLVPGIWYFVHTLSGYAAAVLHRNYETLGHVHDGHGSEPPGLYVGVGVV